MSFLPRFLERPSFAGIKSYLEEGPGEFKLFQLSRKIADIFDQYLLFRPEMIIAWEQGRNLRTDGWQAQLWRQLAGEIKIAHRAVLLNEFLTKSKTVDPRSVEFPVRISLFGISALPLFHLRVLNAVSRFSNVHLFLMNPCREYWGDIMSTGEISRMARRFKTGVIEEDLHVEKGNSLLASMGMLGRDFFAMLYELDSWPGLNEEDLYIEPGTDSLLHCIQSEILNLQHGSPEKNTCGDDGSIQIHSCHSPMREVEILRDNILQYS